MTKKSWIILGCTLGGVVVATTVLVPVLLVPCVYKVNDLRSFVQKYTPIKSNSAYDEIQNDSHPSSKLLFYSFLYNVGHYEYAFKNIKTNGLHNSISCTFSDGTSGEILHINFSYSNNKVMVKFSSFIDEFYVKDCIFHNSYNDEAMPYISTISYSYPTLTCPIWKADGSGIDWDILN